MIKLNEQQVNPRGGFTLIEILLVVVIIGILAAVVIPKFGKHTEEARISSAKFSMDSIALAAGIYEVHNGYYPPNLNALLVKGNEPNWKGPYLEKPPKDPWGREFVYTVKENGFEIKCLGPDGVEGGNDDITR